MTIKTVVVAALFAAAVPAMAMQKTDYERLRDQERAAQAAPGSAAAAASNSAAAAASDDADVELDMDAGQRRQMVAGPSPRKPVAAVTPPRKPLAAAPPRSQPAATPRKSRSQPLSNLQFGYNSSLLQPAARAYLDREAVAILKDDSPGVLLIVGHSSRVGDYASNQALSEARAFAVRDYLVGKGVPAARLRAEGHGYSDLLPGLPPTDERNRRVEYTRVN